MAASSSRPGVTCGPATAYLRSLPRKAADLRKTPVGAQKTTSAPTREIASKVTGPNSCFFQVTFSVRVTLWLNAEDPEPAVPVTVSE
jgi:hypothetical protein